MPYGNRMTSHAALPRCPRDLHGHRPRPPEARWPGGARIAVNHEEGGENNVLHGVPAPEAFPSEITGAEPWPGERHWNMKWGHEYGARGLRDGARLRGLPTRRVRLPPSGGGG